MLVVNQGDFEVVTIVKLTDNLFIRLVQAGASWK
jgi:hypothetical protein